MKITPDELSVIRDAVAPFDTASNRAAYREGRFPRAEATRDIDTRYRWDLFHAAGGWRLSAPLYDRGCNDSHIDTALRAIVPPLSADSCEVTA